MLKPTEEMLPFLQRAKNAASILEVGNAAADAAKVLYGKRGAGIVMGAITSPGIVIGGKPSIGKNLAALEAAIERLSIANMHDVPIFNHLLFKPFVDHFRKQWMEESKAHSRIAYYNPILYQFFEPILKTGVIGVGFFLPRSDKSVGCAFVREQLEKRGKLIVPIDDRFEEVLTQEVLLQSR